MRVAVRVAVRIAVRIAAVRTRRGLSLLADAVDAQRAGAEADKHAVAWNISATLLRWTLCLRTIRQDGLDLGLVARLQLDDRLRGERREHVGRWHSRSSVM
jgi:hypothetical protein